MSYNVFITRAKNWLDEDFLPISEFEWLEFVKTDLELSLLKDNKELVAEYLFYNREINSTCAVWFGDADLPSWYAWFIWSSGLIYTKGIEPIKIEKMIEIARAINANVVSDNEEIYFLAEI